VVIGGELRTPFSLSPQPIPTEGNVCEFHTIGNTCVRDPFAPSRVT
jgi:hypothetical protein